MKPEDARKLLGGWAAGNLTPEERKALMHAALEDQSLFDALADGEALRSLLAEQGVREELIETLESQFLPAAPPPVHWWRRPWAWTLAGGVLAASFAFVVMIRRAERPVQTQTIAQVQPAPAAAQPAAPPIAPPAPAPQPEQAAKAAPLAAAAAKLQPPPPAAIATAPQPEWPAETSTIASFEVSDSRRPAPSPQSGIAGVAPRESPSVMMSLREEAAPMRTQLTARAMPACKVAIERRAGDAWTAWDAAQPVDKDDEVAVRALCGLAPAGVVEVLQGGVERSLAGPPAAPRDRIPLGLLTPGDKRIRVKFPAPQPAVDLRLSVR